MQNNIAAIFQSNFATAFLQLCKTTLKQHCRSILQVTVSKTLKQRCEINFQLSCSNVAVIKLIRAAIFSEIRLLIVVNLELYLNEEHWEFKKTTVDRPPHLVLIILQPETCYFIWCYTVLHRLQIFTTILYSYRELYLLYNCIHNVQWNSSYMIYFSRTIAIYIIQPIDSSTEW